MDDIDNIIDNSISEMNSRSEFGDFVELLLQDYNENLEFWNNQDLYSFLNGLRQYARAPESVSEGIDPERPSWQVFADMLSVARSYWS